MRDPDSTTYSAAVETIATRDFDDFWERRASATPWVLLALFWMALLAAPISAVAQDADRGGVYTHVIPLFMPAAGATAIDQEFALEQGFARIINHSDRAGTVRIYGTDDDGQSYGPVTLSLDAGMTRNFSSHDLEAGNAEKGLDGGLGDGAGSWRLRLESELEFEPAAYVRTSDGFLTAMHAVVRTIEGGEGSVYRVPLFNPASDRSQASLLRLANLTDHEVMVTIEGRDDEGEPAPGGEVRMVLPPNGARHLSAKELESGGAGLSGRLGDGEGRWQLFVTASGVIEVMSLLRTPTGHLINLSLSGLRQADVLEPLPAAGSSFRDCAGCPEMVVVPAGSYLMGSPEDEVDRDPDEGPVHRVTIDEPFAVGRYEVTFAEWDACHADGGCTHLPDDQGWGRGTRPVVDVSWNDAEEYVRWLSGETGKRYRLLSESEWEYAARAGTTTRYWWGDDIGPNRANCDGCGSPWDTRQTAPAGSFPANAFGLHDMHGNVWERVQDCWNQSYQDAPGDGSAWESRECNQRVVRGGGFGTRPRYLRSANRGWNSSDSRLFFGAEAGFRVARKLAAPARHTLPLFPPSGQARQGLARIINLSDRAGTVRIHGTDDAGRRHGPIILSLDARETRHFNSDDLEAGNVSKGLLGGLGNGTGDWRLELSTDLDIEPSAYLRTPDGFFTAMHGVARTVEVEGETVHQVPLFNPGSDHRQVSWLRVANLTDDDVLVTIQGTNDIEPEVRTTEIHEVRLVLPGRAARRFSAQQLESGDSPELSGRLVGTGKRRLFVTADGLVTAGGAIEVMSLVQSPTGHLSNLSTTVHRGFEVVAGGPATVRPLETIHLAVPGGLGDSDYTVVMDLSGTGEFPEDDTVEVDGLTTDDDRILFASPLTQVLPEANTSHRLAVRVRREVDRQLSNVLHFSMEDITIPNRLSGYSSIALEVILKSLYTSVDDPLLNAEAPSIQLGTTVAAAKALGLDTELSDVYSEAILQSLLGVSVSEWAETAKVSPAILNRSSTSLGGGSKQNFTHLLATEFSKDNQVDSALMQLSQCVSGAIAHISDSGNDEPDTCNVHEIGGKMIEGIAEKGNRFTAFIMKLPRNVIGRFVSKSSLQAMSNANAVTGLTVKSMKAMRALNELPDVIDSGRDFVEGVTGKLDLTKEGLTKNFTNGLDAAKNMVRLMPGLLQQAQAEAAHENFDVEKTNAFWTIVNESDRLQREVDVVKRLEDVYTGEETPQEAIKRNPDIGSTVVGSGCKPGYREFPLETADGKTSTCVFESLVEENCYKGSRQPIDVDLGASEACLYYSLDFFQASGTCRENYTRARYQGRWTCRWNGLGSDQPAWYALHKPSAEDTAPPGGGDNRSVSGSLNTISGPEGLSVSGYTINNVPAPPDDPPGPPSTGGKSDCHGDRDQQGRRTGRWVCSSSSGRVSFDTYRAGTYHGPFGHYDSQGRPDGSFGSRDDGSRNGVVVYFDSSSGRVSFDTYRAGTYHGPFGHYDSQGRPDGSFGSRDDGSRNGVVVYFDSSSGRVSFDTYRAGTYHGPFGHYDSQGRPDGSFGSRDDGSRNGVVVYFDSSSGRISFDTYRAGTYHGPFGSFNREGKRDGSFGSHANGYRTGTWTYYNDGEVTSTTTY